jgi:hypothetical protein
LAESEIVTKLTDPERVAAESGVILPFDELKTQSMFLLKEHIDEYRNKYKPDVSKQVAGRAFNQLIDARTPAELEHDRRYSYETDRMEYGLPKIHQGFVVATRLDLGLPELKRNQTSGISVLLQQYAVQVGSVIRRGIELHEQATDRMQPENFIVSLTVQLIRQTK